MQKTARIELPFPPSVNHTWCRSKRGGVFLSKKTRLFRLDVASRILVAKGKGVLPKHSIPGDIRLKTEMRPPDRRVRDLDNYSKALWDALTHAGVWEDDRQIKKDDRSWLDFDGKDKACTILTLYWSEK